MKQPRWLPVVLYCGWFLLVPPLGDKPAPYSEWEPALSFDTASDCEKTRFETAKSTTLSPSDKDRLTRGKCFPTEFFR